MRASDPAQLNTPASQTTHAANEDFAATLSAAGVKPARKNAANKQHDAPSGGSALPPSGNQPPLPLTPAPPLKTDVSAAPVQAPDVAGTVKGPQPGAVGPDPNAAAGGAAAASAPAVSGSATPDAANSGGMPNSGPSMPQASVQSLATAPAAPATAPTVPSGSARDAKLSAGAVSQAATSSTASAAGNATVTDATLGTGPAADAGAAAQAVMAAAVVQGTSAPSQDLAAADDLATPDTGAPLGVAGANDAPASAAANLGVAHISAAATSAPVTAATAAAIAQAALSAADAGAADKRSHGSNPDSSLSLSGASSSAGAAQLLTSNSSTDSVSMPAFKVAAGVGTADFGQGVADRVSLMMDGNLTTAKLQVNPPALGPIEVRIALQGGHAQVWLSSHSAVTRDALESSSPKLREMLGSQGFAQVSVDISHRSFQERAPPSQAYQATPAIGADAAVLAHTSTSLSRSASGLLDAYA